MITPARSQPAPSVSAILDQLDELEALMQRMLAVPAPPGEDTQVPAAAVTGGPPPADPEPPPQTEPAESPRVFTNATPPLLIRRQESVLRDEEGEASAPLVRHVPSRPPVALPWVASPIAAPPPPWRRPLLGINTAFERGTEALGPLGRWLASDAGRAVLGTLGLLLLGGALAWGLWSWRSARAAEGGANGSSMSLAPRKAADRLTTTWRRDANLPGQTG